VDFGDKRVLYETFEDYFGMSANNYYAEQIKINGKVVYNPVRNKTLDEQAFYSHLAGDRSLGIYTIKKEGNTTKFFCVDVDMPKDPDDLTTAWNNVINDTRVIKNEMLGLEIPEENMLFEFSGSKGVHIFIFFEDPIGSREAHRFGMELKNRCLGQVSKDFEIFPKQAYIGDTPGSLGSLLKLPLALHVKSGKRSQFMDPMTLEKVDTNPELILKNISRFTKDEFENVMGAVTYEAKTQTPDHKEQYNLNEQGYKFNMMKNGCDFFQYCIRKVEETGQLEHDARNFLMTLCIKYGKEGQEFLLDLFSKTPGYDRVRTIANLKSALDKNYKPARCRSKIFTTNPSYCPSGGLCEPLKKAGFRYPVNPTALSQPIYRKEKNDIENPIELEHLSLINHDQYNDMVVKIPFKVTGNAADYKVAWKEIFASCKGFRECDNSGCYLHNTGERNISLKLQPETLIELSECNTDAINKVISKYLFACPKKQKSGLRFVKTEDMTVQKLMVSAASENIHSVIKVDDLTGEISYDSKELIDEFGYKPEDKLAYYMGNDLEIDKMYEGIAHVVRHPTQKGQKVLVIHSAKPIEYEALKFDINDPDTRSHLELFASMEIDEMLEEITNGITKIYDRNEMLLTTLLTYSSVIDFIFNNQHEDRGWVESIIIGDAGLGKTAIPAAIMKHTGLGDIASGQTITEAGLVGGVDKDKVFNDVHVIRWGAYPANDKRMLVVDEGQNLTENAMLALRSARQSGEVRINKIVTGRRQARTRLLYLSNAKNNKAMSQFLCGVEALSEILRDSDIRRFDMAYCISAARHDENLVNRHWTELKDDDKIKSRVTGDILRTNIMYAWTRSGGNVSFEDDVEKYILKEISPKLSLKYGHAKSVPLVNPSDIRITIARLSVAMATLRKKNVLKGDFENVKVTYEDVNMIVDLLDKVYSADECRLDVLSRNTAKENYLLRSEIKPLITRILRRIKAETMGTPKNPTSSLTYQVMMRLYNKTTVILHDMVNTTNAEESVITSVFNSFLADQLVTLEQKYGEKKFIIKDKFRELINFMFKNGILKRPDSDSHHDLVRVKMNDKNQLEEIKKEIFGDDI